ncbi:unnamed protein product [Ostreobium quekettii]|uniref:Uncharacterized protein n=1 Tax=Ostreobium quekettii TaxID=121088 RepID=A0A8S1J3K4_9CHLO|nr:unnamed protein product [Ostreobium quekettii]
MNGLTAGPMASLHVYGYKFGTQVWHWLHQPCVLCPWALLCRSAGVLAQPVVVISMGDMPPRFTFLLPGQHHHETDSGETDPARYYCASQNIGTMRGVLHHSAAFYGAWLSSSSKQYDSRRKEGECCESCR